MFEKRITLFTLLGFKVHIDMSWIVLAILITLSLAQGVFPHHYRGLSATTYWWMGIVGALGLFASIVFHEFCHSIIARRYNLPIKGITLFIFGGVAEMEDEPQSAKSEFMMALAGPISSMLLGVVFLIVWVIGAKIGWPVPIVGVVSYLSFTNFILAGFNLLPAFPLDGGRVLRSILWRWKDNLGWATSVASRIGSGFGILFIALGIFHAITGNLMGGVWWFMIGLFLRGASQMSYQNLLIREALEGEPIYRLMTPDPVAVPSSISVEDLVEDYVYRYQLKTFPVVEGEKLLGCVTINEIKDVPKEERHKHKVEELLRECSEDSTIGPNEDAMRAFSTMSRSKTSRLMVVDDSRLIGVIALKDILDLLSSKIDLEE